MRLIDADALEDVLVNHGFCYCGENEYSDGVAEGFLLARDDVENAPTIEAEPVRQGHWIKVGCSFFGVSRYECSVCHYTDEHNESREVPYCWQCGARMENDDNM